MIAIFNSLNKQEKINYLERLKRVQEKHLLRINQPLSKRNDKILNVDRILKNDPIMQRIEQNIISLL